MPGWRRNIHVVIVENKSLQTLAPSRLVFLTSCLQHQDTTPIRQLRTEKRGAGNLVMKYQYISLPDATRHFSKRLTLLLRPTDHQAGPGPCLHGFQFVRTGKLRVFIIWMISLDVRRNYGSHLYIKVIGSRSRSRQHAQSYICVFLQMCSSSTSIIRCGWTPGCRDSIHNKYYITRTWIVMWLRGESNGTTWKLCGCLETVSINIRLQLCNSLFRAIGQLRATFSSQLSSSDLHRSQCGR